MGNVMRSPAWQTRFGTTLRLEMLENRNYAIFSPAGARLSPSFPNLEAWQSCCRVSSLLTGTMIDAKYVIMIDSYGTLSTKA